MFLSLHMIFSQEGAAALTNGIGPFVRDDWSHEGIWSYPQLQTLTLYLDLSLEAIQIACDHFRPVRTNLRFVLCGGFNMHSSSNRRLTPPTHD